MCHDRTRIHVLCTRQGTRRRRVVVLAVGCMVSWVLLSCGSVNAQGLWEAFVDPVDGKFDTSYWLLEQKGFFPVPILVTEPAVGYGGGAALLFFHEAKTAPEPNDVPAATTSGSPDVGRRMPPSISGAFGLGTENETWVAGGFHFGSWKQDRIRYTGGFATPSVNLDFYGGGDSSVLEDGVEYNLEGWLLLQELTFRMSDSNVFIGGRFIYSDTRSEFDIPNLIPGVETWELDHDSVGLGVVTRYDSRDNIFTPNRGVYAALTSTLFNTSGAVGNRREYQITEAKGEIFRPWREDWVLGWRLHGRFSTGAVPYYALPSVELRGIPAMRYQGQHALMTEVELRYNLTSRWSLVGFTGVGKTLSSLDDFDEGKFRWAGGVGVRYLVARLLGLYSGLDLAFGPEDTTVYIQFGHAWGR